MNEHEIILQAQEGDDTAFDTLVLQTVSSAYQFVRSLGATIEDADDVIQDSYVKVWRSLNQFDMEKPFRPWLFQIVKRTYIDTQRKSKAILFGDMQSADEDTVSIADSISDPEPLPDEVFATKESRETVRRALSFLSPIEHTVLSMRYDESFSFEDIAEVLERPAGTVRSIHHRALTRLRAHLENLER